MKNRIYRGQTYIHISYLCCIEVTEQEILRDRHECLSLRGCSMHVPLRSLGGCIVHAG